MAVRLVPHVPDYLVPRRIEQVMERHRQLHHAEAGGQVPPGLRDVIYYKRPQLVGELLEFVHRQFF